MHIPRFIPKALRNGKIDPKLHNQVVYIQWHHSTKIEYIYIQIFMGEHTCRPPQDSDAAFFPPAFYSGLSPKTWVEQISNDVVKTFLNRMYWRNTAEKQQSDLLDYWAQ